MPGLLGWIGWIFCTLFVSRTVGTSREFPETEGHLLHADERNFTKQNLRKQEPFEQQQQPVLPGSTFNLRVQVSDTMTRRPLSQAAAELFVDHALNSSALSGDDGSVRLRVPFQPGLPVTVVATKRGFLPALLPCKSSRMPIFSSVSTSLLPLNEGNVWFFEDSVLITGRTSAGASQPTVRVPQRLLNLKEIRNFTSIRSYLTVPKLTSEQGGSLNTLGVVGSHAGYASVELTPVAAVSVELFSGDDELKVGGPIQISLSVPENRGLQDSDVVPAWFFNRTVGGWMRKGLGKMTLVDGHLMWVFNAPHLGYWIAAPLTSTRGFFGLSSLVDFISQHSFFLLVLVGGTLAVIACLLIGLLLYCRSISSPTKSRQTTVVRRDQTTSTDDEESRTSSDQTDGQNQSQARCNGSVTLDGSEVIANPSAVVVSLEGTELDFLDATSEHTRAPASLPDGFFFYNQPVAILPAPAFFHLDEHLEQSEWSRSATLPRVGASNAAGAEPQRKEGLTQTPHTEEFLPASEGSPTPTCRTPFTLPESASVPGTLSKLAGSRHSVHAVTALSKIPSPKPPRAWFVSLEGKPAAEIRYAVSEQQRRRRPMESRETSLDSGVDLSELNQTTGRRAVTLERNATFIKNPSSNKPSPQP